MQELVRNFASAVVEWEALDGWVSRFLHRDEVDLAVKWSASLDPNRRQADFDKKQD